MSFESPITPGPGPMPVEGEDFITLPLQQLGQHIPEAG